MEFHKYSTKPIKVWSVILIFIHFLAACGGTKAVSGRVASSSLGAPQYSYEPNAESVENSTFDTSLLNSPASSNSVDQNLQTLEKTESQNVLDQMLGDNNQFTDVFEGFLQMQNAQDLQKRTSKAMQYLAMMMANSDFQRQQEIADFMKRIAAEIQKQKKKALDPNSIGGMFKRILSSILGYVTAKVESKLGAHPQTP